MTSAVVPRGSRTLGFDAGTHVYRDEVSGVVLPGISQLLEAAGWHAWTHNTERRDDGQRVHQWTAAYDRGATDTAPCHRCFAYLDFTSEVRHTMVYDGIEQPVADWRHWFAGTPDRWGTFQGHPMVMEIKTGRRTMREWSGRRLSRDDVQTALQSILLEASTGIPSEDRRRYVLYLSEKRKLVECTHPDDFVAAHEALTCVDSLIAW